MAKRLWWFLLGLEALILAGFAAAMLRAPYFQKMPESVRQGASIGGLVAARILYLAATLAVVNCSFWLWARGVQVIERRGRARGAAILAASLMGFVFALLSFITLMIFGFPQY